MSHMTIVKTKFVDAESIKRAAARLFPDCRVVEGGVVRGWHGTTRKADIIIEAPDNNTFDIGFVKNDEGSYDCVTDFYGSKYWAGNETQFTGNFKQAYNAERTKKEVEYLGHYASESTLDDGTIQFEINQY